ncbi:MAG TPA: glucoamylase family protein, partial [Chthonomonadales bacterium]|nr:glucoamylase family protein [Chthonomonadales bacterium]
EGHFLNWYELSNLQPLLPRYVSMVDSGNLLAHLWTLEHGIDQCLAGPVLHGRMLEGIAETVSLLQSAASQERHWDARIPPEIEQLASLNAAAAPAEIIGRVLTAVHASGELAEHARRRGDWKEPLRYWAIKLEQELIDCRTLIDRYLSWVETLNRIPQDEILLLGSGASELRTRALGAAPSLRALATGGAPELSKLLESALAVRDRAPGNVQEWIDSLSDQVGKARWFAGERLAEANRSLELIQEFDRDTSFRFLYNPERRLFAIGYNVSERKHDASSYDLLASEARLGSFVAIARGDVPTQHWFALGRPFGLAFNRRVLLSWSGTLFEYLMPLLVCRAYENSILEDACREAVLVQIAYAAKIGIPWGISEAAYSALDERQVYQYRAFGVPGLGMKRGLEEDLVVSPYASALALAVAPHASVRNLLRLSRLARTGLRGGYGYYESLDYTRQRGPQGDRGVIVYAYMAHHQGMTLVAINNALNGGIMRSRFHSDPRVRAAESLLYERMPAGPAITRDYVREAPLTRIAAMGEGPAVGRFDTADTQTPRTQILASGDYSVLVTNSGAGYSRWKDKEITRWRADTTRDSYGSFFYVRDLESGAAWSAGFQPTGHSGTRYTVLFSSEKAEIKRRDYGIETQMEILVSPEDPAEVRRITLVNHSNRPRRIDLTSYAELALAPHSADRAHPAFSKLFVQTEAVSELGALLAHRRPRSSQESEVWAGHIATFLSGNGSPEIEFETDRSRFLGRGRSAAAPAALRHKLSG